MTSDLHLIWHTVLSIFGPQVSVRGHLLSRKSEFQSRADYAGSMYSIQAERI